MNNILKYIKGDKQLWAVILLMSIISFLPVYSASSNLQYVVGSGTTLSHFFKHLMFIMVGLGFVVALQFVDYKYFGAFALLLMPLVIIALVATIMQGTVIGGAGASRWLKIPGIPFAFQTSTFAGLILLTYISRYLTKIRHGSTSIASSFLELFMPILIIIGLIFPANGSTALMLFVMTMIVLFIGGYPFKYLMIISGTMIIAASLFIFVVLNFGEKFENHRVDTWKSRIENFMNPDKSIESYQVKHAKAAIVEGGAIGKGPGKSALKQTLPQSSSDFIFAIIVEEYGWFGIGLISFCFLFILYRIIIIGTKIHTFFGSLLVFAIGLPIVMQAFINMAVAVNLFPVTGQPLPLISYGGTSMWVTYISLGMILSVSRHIKPKEELEKELKSKNEKVIHDIA